MEMNINGKYQTTTQIFGSILIGDGNFVFTDKDVSTMWDKTHGRQLED